MTNQNGLIHHHNSNVMPIVRNERADVERHPHGNSSELDRDTANILRIFSPYNPKGSDGCNGKFSH
ncbi:hypothetical protein [Imperialibacter roseus]|uniref:Uncharacterized protein n=1 Tax=Imperialibacter roseus TaxID=1324217 RepID=A0ABZ0IU29_9BACT|nr:hypothetical protein [Imperialibacter roseus]WOK08550.1 hypothetical protein RT717_07870 [Imperialibacter roseus]